MTTSFQEEEQFLSRPYSTKEEFVREYEEFRAKKSRSKRLYLLILTKLKDAISLSDIDSLRQLSTFIDYLSVSEDKATLRNYYDDSKNPIKTTNLVILACKHNRLKILEYLFSNESKILSKLYVTLIGATLLPQDEDKVGHNAFYYAVHSSNCQLLDVLINKWPNNYFSVHSAELDEILSQAYEQLKLQNVPLSEEMEVFVENNLINLRFFSNSFNKNHDKNFDFNNIAERIELVLQNISLLKEEYTNTELVDEKFLFIAKCIAQNIHILKRQLKFTYDRLPWEEIEFCLVSFVSSHIKQQEINLFYKATLNKNKILQHLENFSKKIAEEKDTIKGWDSRKFTDFSNLKREKVVTRITRDCPQFEALYSDYHQINDLHSLEKISSYINLALSADAIQREGQLIITRALQVIGEYCKNTLESPKLSNNTCELLLLSLPKNTRQVVIDLRNSLSHACSLNKRTEIEENADVKFFIGVQNDTKKINNVITDILYKKKNKIIRLLLKKIIDSESYYEIKEVCEILSSVNLDKRAMNNFNIMEYDQIEKLIKRLRENITDETVYEKELFNKIYSIINFVKTKSENNITDYSSTCILLQMLGTCFNENKIDQNFIRGMKHFLNKILSNATSQMDAHNLKDIVELSWKISRSALSRIRMKVKLDKEMTNLSNSDKLEELNRLTCEIFCIVESETSNIKWVEDLREKLNEKGMFIPTYKQRKAYNITEEKFDNQLALKLSELKSIFRNNALGEKSDGKLPSYKRNKQLQAAVEMLVLDIMSLLGRSEKYLENNIHFLDDNSPLLTGKCLRNHLAHDNTLVDELLSDPSIAVFSNAEKLASDNVLKSNKKIGKLVRDDPSKLRNKYDRNLTTIAIKENMFSALKEGNLEDLKSCLRKGADINARSVSLSTALHFAAQGLSLEIIKFLLDQQLSVVVKDVNGQSPIHLAAAYGRTNIVEFFIREIGVDVDDVDYSGKTPLHLAAKNGHKDTVETLLRNNSNSNIRDKSYYLPLHHAIKNNHIDVAKILMGKERNVDINEFISGYTCLHLATLWGHLALVHFLLRNKANVNARNDEGVVPMHLAAVNGYPEIVNALILKGADVNARALNGCTPLHYGAEGGNEKVVNLLLKHGADINAVGETFNNTPLHFASKHGHEKIVKTLLKYNADVHIATVYGFTPLHFAAQSGHSKIVAHLIEHGANIHAKSKMNVMPLHCAAESGHKNVVQILIKNEAEINVTGYKNLTPLHLAAVGGHRDIVDLLLKNKADVDARDVMGSTPLHLAALSGHKRVIELLIKNKAEIDARKNDGMTPLYGAAFRGHYDAAAFLIESKAKVNMRTKDGLAPLSAAIGGGCKDIVNLLIENGASVNAGCGIDNVPSLHLAVQGGLKDIVQILIKCGANVNTKFDGVTPLFCAVRFNHKEIIEILVENSASVTEEVKALSVAVFAGYRDIVELLLKNNAPVNTKLEDGNTVLHFAANAGHKGIVNSLISRGAIVDAMNISNTTPLFSAAQEGHAEIVEILIANRANLNCANVEGAPIHIAAVNGHANVIDILLKNGAKVHVKDNQNRTALELAVSHGHLQVVKMLLEKEKVDMNAKGNDGWTKLHIASQENNLEMVRYLVDKGCNMRAKIESGALPIHIAAREGFKDTVEYFLSKGLSVNERGMNNQTLLHYAAMKPIVVKYLIAQGADINAKDKDGITTLHIASCFGNKEVIELLLKNGAIYNAVDKLYRSPSDVTNDVSVSKLFESTRILFESVLSNKKSMVELATGNGAFVNAKNADGVTPLHYAAWKGYEGVVDILLQNKANPNAVGKNGSTPLHYAAKFSHLKVVKALLSHGAMYNAATDSGKTPANVATNRDIVNIFQLISESFEKVKKNNVEVLRDLIDIKDTDTIKAIMNTRNRENKTLIAAAKQNNFSKIHNLKQLFQNELNTELIDTGLSLLSLGSYQKALRIFKGAFERGREILGPDHPSTLDIQTHIATTLYKQGSYQESLNMLEEIFQKQKQMLSVNDKDTLSTMSTIALVLHRQGKNKEAFNLFQEVYEKQKELLGPDHSEVLNTHFHLALVLNEQGKYEEALNINRAVFEKSNETLGPLHHVTLCTQNNIALVLSNQGKYEESLKIYKEVLDKKKKMFGDNHADTLNTLSNIAALHDKQNNHHEALKTFQEVLDIQIKTLPKNHPDILITQYNIGSIFFGQTKYNSALKAYGECFDQFKAVFGSSHPCVLSMSQNMEVMNSKFKLPGFQKPDVRQPVLDIIFATSKGDAQAVQNLLEDGIVANCKDNDVRTPLHHAAYERRYSC